MPTAYTATLMEEGQTFNWQWQSRAGFSGQYEWECERLIEANSLMSIIELANIYEGYPDVDEHLVMMVAPQHARLIAAAPALYEACKTAMRALCHVAQITDETRLGWAMKAIDEAMTKAEGRQL